MKPDLRVLSLGAGVQSSALALMIEKGEIPMVDCAIFADTGAEPEKVRWLDAYEKESGWHSLNDALKIRPPEVLSVGYVLAETEEYLILAADIGSDKMDNDVGRVQVIPGQWLLSKKEIL